MISFHLYLLPLCSSASYSEPLTISHTYLEKEFSLEVPHYSIPLHPFPPFLPFIYLVFKQAVVSFEITTVVRKMLRCARIDEITEEI